jgi:glycosyltransferase involved in cell wall biosynthesis
MPKVSVTICSYNCGMYIREALESILGQTFRDFELIVVNDGSTDNTREILESYSDPRMTVIHQENIGIPKSRNRAIDIARGEYIAIQDADDISLPERLEKEVAFLDAHPHYAAVGSAFYKLYENGQKSPLIRFLTDDDDIRKGLRRRNWFLHSSVMMRKEAFRAVGGYDEQFKYALDYDLFLRLSMRYKLANLEDPLCLWRVRSDSVTHFTGIEQDYYGMLAVAKHGGNRVKIYVDFLMNLCARWGGAFLRRHGLGSVANAFRKVFFPHIPPE